MWFLTAYFKNSLITFLIAMVPVLELRGSIPYAYHADLNMWLSIFISVLGNLLPVPFIIIYMRRLLNYIRKHFPKFNGVITRIENRAERKSKSVLKYAFWGLFLLVAIPLPGTGGWTGAMVAAVLNMRMKKAFPAIALGVIAAAVIVSFMTWGVFDFLVK